MKALFIAAAVLVVAILIEVYKKVFRGVKDEEGNIKTKAKSWEVYIFAFIASAPWGVGCSIQVGEGINWYIAFLWTVAIYAMQYIVDMALVKKTVNGLLKRLGG